MRRVPLVFLLHASGLNADSIDQLVAVLPGNDLQPAALEMVM